MREERLGFGEGGKAIAEGMCPSFLSYRGFFSLLPSVKSMKGGGEEERKSWFLLA